MELRVLRYFLTVVDERNITHAADKLHISQPTISRQLRDLEDEIGVKLFERGSRTIDLTSSGEYFVHQARQIVALTDKTVANVQRTQEVSGSIMIGSAEAPMMATVATAIGKLRETAPRVDANIYSTDANDVHNRMKTGLLDFGVVMEPTDKNDYHFINLPGTTGWGVLVRRDSYLGSRASVTVTDLQDQKVITPQQHGSIDVLSDWLGSSEHQLDIVATYNLLYNASIMVTAGVGIALCLDGIINTANTDLRFIPLAPRLEGHASLIWPKTGQMSPAAISFLKAMKDILPNNE
ncbi:LysR family transcriptional regulator [Weissella paramesenteroides]|uniref:LysR family transcriptional regulator n=1 Tax=Weissella paramesenteroides TaxID=1249 RepID=UPI00123B522E|nr:LysR family transcriptional regulator [Weissella paramesenteroides]KAA8440342.1 LysR family transcriptional regulator [Weissella paramesenteroides]KAA8440622.1 LysR family transcriptional regulator [Weissella paramesenteroides]KAA8440717.1 LysR family transcriptional regulator [Weissella paramesenteroides]KAA8445669.1 LysR family transcriptional regulator [Weissella paramesenteroides]KAA8448521.1 LysR family transcriptional regulator [Weissella paramesenteroides]